MKRVIVIGSSAVAAVVAVAIGLTALMYSSLDDLVKIAIETVGSEVTGTPVKVEAVEISLSEGRGTVKGLSVGNPPGFATPTAFQLSEITLALDLGSITNDPVVVKEIVVTAPKVTYEMGANGSNIDVLQRAIKARADGAAGKEKSVEQDGPNLVINRLAVTKGSVTLATPIPGAAASATLGEIALTGIGRNESGASANQVAEHVMSALVNSALQSAKSMGIGTALDGVGTKALEAAPAEIGGAIKGLF